MMTPPAFQRSAVFTRTLTAPKGEDAVRSSPSTRLRIVVGDGARWLAVGSGARFDLCRRVLLRRLLAHLVARGVEAPGEPCPARELIAAGWPGERIPIECAMNRLYVALCYLRKYDLAEVLRSDPDGWFLDPSVDIQREGSR